MEMKIGKEFPIFSAWIDALKTINEEHTIEANEEGLHSVAMDNSHVAMIDTKFRKELFEDYSVTGDKETVTLNVADLSKFLNRIGKDEKVSLRKDDKQSRVIIETRLSGRARQFSIATLEDFDNEVPEPKIFFKSKGRIVLKGFEDALKDAALVSEHIVLDFKDEKFKVSGYGDMADTFMEWTKDSDDILQLEIQEPAKATYTLSYVEDMIKAAKPLSEVLTLELTQDMPLKIDAEGNLIDLVFYMAPCIGV